MKNYTLQKDFGKYGARWACCSASILNIAENEINRKLTKTEIKTVIGEWLLSQSVSIANYHSHKQPLDRTGFTNEWSPFNDPEWHFLVNNFDICLTDVFKAIGKKAKTKKAVYKIVLFDVYAGHYCLMINDKIINPDPSIDISNATITKIIKMEV